MKIRPDQFDAMRGQPWGLRSMLRDALDAMGHTPSFDPLSGDLLFNYDRTGATRVRFRRDGKVNTIEEPGDRVTRVESDDRGRPLALANTSGTTRIRYDEVGHVIGIAHPDGSAQSIDYRGGKPIELRRNDGASVGIEWTEQSDVAGLRDGRGATLGFGYDAQGRITRVDERGGSHATFGYADDGRLEQIRTPGGALWRFETDPLTGIRSTVAPDGTRESSISEVPTLKRFVLRDGSTVWLTIDGMGRPTTVDYAHEPPIRLAWAEQDLLASADNGAHPARFEYDAAGRRTVDEVDGARVEVSYDGRGSVAAIGLPSGEKLRFIDDGRTTKILDWDGNEYAIEHAASGAVTSIAFPGALRERMRVRATGQLEHQEFEAGSSRISRTYAYDANDLVAAVDDSLHGPKRHTFDADDRLVAVASSRRHVAYTWDPDGNLIARDGERFEYDALNRIRGGSAVRCRCDALGNLVAWEDASGRSTLRYNRQSQLVSVELPGGRVVEYEYDALGRRIVKRAGALTTRFIWFGEQLLSEVTSGPSPSRTDYLYVPGTARPLAMRRDGQIFFYQVDHLDTPIRLFDRAGAVVWQAEPFGTEIDVLADAVPQPLRYPGQYYDAETGLHYNVARYYQPRTGRYTSADPPFYQGESNPYRYARCNPTAFADPSGRNPLLAGAVIAVGLGAAIGAVFGAAHKVVSNVFVDDKPWSEGVGEAIVRGAIAGGAGGLGAFAGALGGALLGPVGAVAGAIIGGFIGVGAASAAMAAYDAPEGMRWEACEDAAISSIPFVGSIKRYRDNKNDPNRGKQLAVDLGFDIVSIALIVVGAKRGYSGAKAAEAAAETGMGKIDGIRQQHYAKKTGRLIVDRASNEASRQYDGKPGYRPKPHDVETLKTAKEGENAGLVVEPENPTPEQQAEIARLKEEGWSFDEQGRLVDPEGNKVHGDYDLQGVYQSSTDAQGNRAYGPVDTNDPAFREQYNREVTSGRDMLQHGANDDYVVIDANGNEKMGRSPEPNEVYKVTDENGNTTVINSTAELQKFYEDRGIDWPYDNYR